MSQACNQIHTGKLYPCQHLTEVIELPTYTQLQKKGQHSYLVLIIFLKQKAIDNVWRYPANEQGPFFLPPFPLSQHMNRSYFSYGSVFKRTTSYVIGNPKSSVTVLVPGWQAIVHFTNNNMAKQIADFISAVEHFFFLRCYSRLVYQVILHFCFSPKICLCICTESFLKVMYSSFYWLKIIWPMILLCQNKCDFCS